MSSFVGMKMSVSVINTLPSALTVLKPPKDGSTVAPDPSGSVFITLST